MLLPRRIRLLSSLSGVRTWRSVSTGTSTAVMSFGDGTHGALGLPSSLAGVGIGIGGDDAYEPTKIPNLPADVISVTAGHYHSLAVTSQGHLWAWGRNHEFQLGRDPLSLRSFSFIFLAVARTFSRLLCILNVRNVCDDWLNSRFGSNYANCTYGYHAS